MIRQTILFLSTLIVLSVNTFEVKNIQHEINPKTSEQYLQYIKVLSGIISEEQLVKNLKLAAMVQNQRFSVLNSIQEIVLVLVDQIKDGSQDLLIIKDIQSLENLDQMLENFSVLNLAELNAQTLAKRIEQLSKSGKVVNTLQMSSSVLRDLKSRANRRLQQKQESQSDEDSSDSQHSSTSDQASDKSSKEHKSIKVAEPLKRKTSSSYILKFFFGFVFIIISLGTLSAIANMENRKDTLLYAKFITDVAAR